MECGITKQSFGDIKDALREYWFEVGEKQIIAAALLHALVLLVCRIFHLEESGLNIDFQILSVAFWCFFSALLADKWIKGRNKRDVAFMALIGVFVGMKRITQWLGVALFVTVVVMMIARANALFF